MKKRFFSTAVAVVAAMSLSVGAFADADIANPGWSDLVGGSDYEETVVLADCEDGEVVLGSDEGLAIVGNVEDFPAGVTSVTLVASVGQLKAAPAAEAVENIKTVKKNVESVTYGISVTLYDQNHNSIEPVNPLEVHIASNNANKASTFAAYISDNGADVEVITLKRNSTRTVFIFSAPHFSNYYLATTKTTTGGTIGGGGNGSDPALTSDAASTTAPDAENTDNSGNNGGDTTQAPSDTTVDDGNNGNTGNNGGDTTQAPSDTTAAPAVDDGNNGNTGNTDGTGNDKNQATGVVLGVIPAAIAAAAVVISKKRK
ncbi:MAG: hypothetical protein HDT46_06605 [Ruminococcaceae bacterium]|nr:hypothetical protein [Oscillospiraceae bacterium]